MTNEASLPDHAANKRKCESEERKGSHKKVCRKCIANRASLKYAGPYILGPRLGNSPVKSITQCLARKMGTDKFNCLKLLTMRDCARNMQDMKQGKMLIHTEFSLLSLLHDQDGVIHTHGLFQDEVEEPLSNIQNTTSPIISVKSETCKSYIPLNRKPRRCKRLCLVLDCLSAHDYSPLTQDLVNLQHYVIKEKKLSEREAVIIFLDIVRVVKDLHTVSRSTVV